jgi:hypothetical protein
VRELRSSLIRQERRGASRPLKPEQKRWDTCYTVSADATVIPGGIHLKMPMTKSPLLRERTNGYPLDRLI